MLKQTSNDTKTFQMIISKNISMYVIFMTCLNRHYKCTSWWAIFVILNRICHFDPNLKKFLHKWYIFLIVSLIIILINWVNFFFTKVIFQWNVITEYRNFCVNGHCTKLPYQFGISVSTDGYALMLAQDTKPIPQFENAYYLR